MKALLCLCIGLAFVAAAIAGPKTYQITGPVIAVDEASITIKAKREKWQFSRDASATPQQQVKVGDIVTVTYWMTSATVELKDKKSVPGKPEAGHDSTPKDGSGE